MIKRTIEISGHGNHLGVTDGSLCIRRGGEVVGRAPLEDVGVLILDAATTTYTHAVLTRVLAAGAVIVPCGSDHLPAGMFLPQNNSLQTQRLRAQASAKQPLRKRLWQQIVRAKIAHQAACLPPDEPAGMALRAMVRQVRSGDPTNVEAQAARRYWRVFFGDPEFRRRRDGLPPNNLLNYGYMVLRAAVARALCGAGLHPSLGLHHSNRGNPFCLADDLLEPLRPLVDAVVRDVHLAGEMEVTRDAKVALLSVLTETVTMGGDRGPLLVALERVTASLVRCYAGEQKRLELPSLWN